ncbi:MAG: acylphosphatase [Termitinemataceae bacterium]|nr:MAG: acylphosphatase [Termitinemataceae bacterium]
MENTKTAFDAGIYGRVQGVAFRYYAAEKAQQLHITGWVRNNSDGSVEVHAEGSGENIKLFLDWLHVGPSHARVDSINFTYCKPTGFYKRFVIEC